MNHQRSLIAVVALACSGIGVAETRAGALCDWLCHRKRAAPGTTAYRPVTPPTTAAVPQGSCGPGWCQQTVVKYMPQVAYRTVYQPVPVTTYKTSTSINPANGLPRTCTRPCTSYQYQARRVPYTTYRPVYTTVPVSDPLANQPVAPPPAATTPWQSTGYAPASPSCNTCSSAPATTSWSAPPTNSTPGSYNAAGATPWQPVPPSNTTSAPPPPGYGTPSYDTPSYGVPQDTPGSTPWSSDRTAAPSGSSTGGTPADQRPALKPETSTSSSGLTPVPKPQAVLRQELKREQQEDAQRTQEDGVTDFNRVYRPAPSSTETPSQVAGPPIEGLFQTGESSTAQPAAKEPALQPPANQPSDPRSARRYENAIRDVQRSYYPSNDQTAARRASTRVTRGTMPRVQPPQWQPTPPATRYAAAPAGRTPQSRAESVAPQKHQWIPR